jgi:hypothetical protein
MNKNIVLLAAAAFLCAGCDQVKEKVAEHKKKVVVAEEAAAKAQAKFAARAAFKAEGPAGKAGNAGAAVAVLLCSSPKLMEDIEGSMGLLEALGGEGGDPAEQKRQFLASRGHYRSILEKELPARGASYEEFAVYSQNLSAEQKQKFTALVSEKCPRGDKELVEKTAGGLMRYFADKGQ